MLKLLTLVFLLSLLSLTAHGSDAQPEPRFLEGQQLEEKLIRWLFQHRHGILQSCLNDRAHCSPEDALRPLLSDTLKAIDAAEGPLEFVREAEHPELFRSAASEVHRIAVTSRAPGAKIIFNRDRIPGLTLEGLAAILFHEFAHHTGAEDDATRRPDQVGARIATHLTTHLFTSGLDEVSLPQAKVLIFQQAFKELYQPEDLARPLANFALLTDGRDVLDFSLLPFPAARECDGTGERVVAQKSSQPGWHVDHSGPDGFLVRMVSSLENYCTTSDQIGLRAESVAQTAARVFRLQVTVGQDGRIQWNTLSHYLTDPTADDYFDAIKTAKVLAAQLSTTTLHPGDELTMTAIVQILNQNAPTACTAGFFSPSWPKQKDELSVLSGLDSCGVEKLQDGTFKVTGKFRVPLGMMTGDYVFYAAGLNSVDSNPSMVDLSALKFRVIGAATSNFSIESVRFSGVPPVAKIGAQPLTNSVIYSLGQEFDLVVDVHSPIPLNRQLLDLGLGVQYGSGLHVATFAAEPKDLGFLIVSAQAQKTTTGTRLIYRVRIPRDVKGNNVFVLLVKRVLIEDTARNWTEIRFPDNDHMVLMDRFVEAN